MFDFVKYWAHVIPKFSGDTDYLWRLKAWIHVNKNEYKLQDHTECLYIAYIRENNLTVNFPISGKDRQDYFQKITKDINNVMVPNNNFYREIF